MGGLFPDFLGRWRVASFRRKWRRANPHNETQAINLFDPNRVRVGPHSYGGLQVESWGGAEEFLEIGALVSIAGGVKFLLGGNHLMDRATTYPIGVKFLGAELDATSKGKITVGDDVWIGMDALVLSGSSVGRGAVIGARSVVACAVPPYAVFVGNPGRVVRYRFDAETARILSGIDFSALSADSLRKLGRLLTAPIGFSDPSSAAEVADACASGL